MTLRVHAHVLRVAQLSVAASPHSSAVLASYCLLRRNKKIEMDALP